MIKSKYLFITICISVCLLMSSCYVHKSVVGAGAYKDIEAKAWNHYLLFGLIPVRVADTKDMAEGAIDYTIRTSHTIPNRFLSLLTLGIWTTTTTTVSQ